MTVFGRRVGRVVVQEPHECFYPLYAFFWPLGTVWECSDCGTRWVLRPNEFDWFGSKVWSRMRDGEVRQQGLVADAGRRGSAVIWALWVPFSVFVVGVVGFVWLGLRMLGWRR